MAFTQRLSPTRGSLVRLRAQLEFVQSGLNVLKLKRDRLAEELNLLLKDMTRREKAEKQLVAVYDDFKVVLAMLGYSKVRSTAYSGEKLKIDVKENSVMNVLFPSMQMEQKPAFSNIEDPSLYKVAQKMAGLIEEWLKIGCIEATVERIAYELSLVNRKINALEKVVVPNYSAQIKYIEEFLSDEELEEFTRIKHLKVSSREAKV